MRKTIAIDFDGVIHRYRNGWFDGTIYDEPRIGAFESIEKLMQKYNVFILSTRSPWQINKWLKKYLYEEMPHPILANQGEFLTMQKYDFSHEVIWQPWVKFWNKEKVLGITNRKLPAIAYIDDRSVLFKNWKDILKQF